MSVSVLASTPFTVAVGGTMFNENGHNSTYWNSTNVVACFRQIVHPGKRVERNLHHSVFRAERSTVGRWRRSQRVLQQALMADGVAGIPSDSKRDIPDVSLSGGGSDPYLLCFEASCATGDFFGVSGTSASAPSFAGIMALIVQKQDRVKASQITSFIRLAHAETLSGCNASKTTGLPASTCVFNDVTAGNNAVPVRSGTEPRVQNIKYSRLRPGYRVGLGERGQPGKRLELGCVQAYDQTLTLAPLTTAHGNPANVTVTVAPNSGTGTATGDVSLVAAPPAAVRA